MATIDNLINVSITNETAAVSVPSFSVPLLLGETDAGWPQGDNVHTYSAPADMLADGFSEDDAEYLAAVAMYSGSITPATFMVGRRASSESAADALTAIQTQDNSWYCVILIGGNDADVLALAPIIESEKKILLASSQDPAILSSTSTANLALSLKAKGFKRTALVCTLANAVGLVESAWAGSQLPQTPGSNNWAYKSLPGITPDAFTANQLAQAYGAPLSGTPGRDVNVYISIGGTPVTFPGIMAGGQYIDITIGFDWLMANIQTAIFARLQASGKVPYTDAGAAMLMDAVNQVLRQAATNGLLDDQDPTFPILVSCPHVSTVSSNRRAARIAPDITFQCRLQGAFNSVDVVGTVSV
ncbi:hypothetical protein Q3G72_004356 [Acer saccharum]|nr:hypothetical protein Q3G72_004356 [Acer saccharum]